MKKGKKLTLNKEVITQLNEASMKEIRGGEQVNFEENQELELFNTHVACITIKSKGCKTQNSCTILACF